MAGSMGDAVCCGWKEAPIDNEGIPQITLIKRKGFIAHVKYVFLRVLCAPMDLIGLTIVLTVGILWGKKANAMGFDNRVFWAQIDEDSWPGKTWYRPWGATTFAHNVMFGRNGQIHRPDLWAHELNHVEQYEAEAVQATAIVSVFGLLKLLGIPAEALLYMFMMFLMAFNGLTVFGSAMITAWLRGEDAYSGSHLEEASRARVETNFKA